MTLPHQSYEEKRIAVLRAINTAPRSGGMYNRRSSEIAAHLGLDPREVAGILRWLAARGLAHGNEWASPRRWSSTYPGAAAIELFDGGPNG